jgi:hypothetical protein
MPIVPKYDVHAISRRGTPCTWYLANMIYDRTRPQSQLTWVDNIIPTYKAAGTHLHRCTPSRDMKDKLRIIGSG